MINGISGNLPRLTQTAGMVAALFLLTAARAMAAGFSVTPIPIMLSPAQTSVLLKVTNGGDSDGSFQIQTFSWTQTPDGTMELSPSAEIVAFPAVFTLGGNQIRNIRIGAVRRPGVTEDTYRIVVQQLPPPPVPGKSTIQVLAAFDLPVFATPAAATAAPAIAAHTFSSGALSFSVTNAGTAHFRIDRLTVTGHDPAGHSSFAIAAAPSYVLAGGQRDYTIDIAPHDCTAIQTITIAASLSEPFQTITTDVPVPPSACAGAQAPKTSFEGDTRQAVKFLPGNPVTEQ